MLAIQARPSIVFLDIGLPGMDGYAVARKLRSYPSIEKTTIIAITGYGQREDIRKTREAGLDFHLVKPADIAKITDLLATLPLG